MKLMQPPVQRMRATISTASTATQRARGRAGVEARAEIVRRDFGVCQHCKRIGRVSVGDEVDHIVPLEQGGSDSAANKQLLCIECHRTKTKAERAQYRSTYPGGIEKL